MNSAEIKETIRRNITAFRTMRGMTKAQLARACGVSNPTVINWENGRNFLDAEMLFRVSDALSVSVDALSGRTPEGISLAEIEMIRKFRAIDLTQQTMIQASIDAAYAAIKKDDADILSA